MASRTTSSRTACSRSGSTRACRRESSSLFLASSRSGPVAHASPSPSRRRKRVELEDYLTRYVQTYAESAVEPAEPELAGPAARVRFENSTLAGPSNSGLEPVSLSGTGSGIRLPPLAHPLHPAAIPHLDGSAVISDPRSVAIAREIISSLETLFQSSLLRTTRTRTPASASVPLPQLDPSRLLPGALDDSNEKYFANLLSHDFLSQGFVYLNLCLTMAQIYRFNVTVAFVQRAVRQFSHNLELSDDGGRIRWKGPRSPAVVDDAALDVEMGDLVEFVKAGDTGKGKAREPDSVDGASSAPSRSTRASGSRDPSSGASSSLDPSVGTGTLLADSLAPSSRTGQTSLPSTGRKTSSTEPPRPVRPTAAVLQPMDRLLLSASPDESPSRTLSEAEVNGARTAKATAPAVADAAAAAAPEPVEPVEGKEEQQHDKASSGKAGSDALSTANLDAHNLGIELVQTLRTHASSQAVASTTTSSGKNAVGALVFYGNGLFCSDLSKEGEGPVTPPILPPKGELASRPLGALDEDDDEDDNEDDEQPSAAVETEAMDIDDENSPIDLDSAVLDVVGDEPRGARSSSEGDGSGSGTSSLQRLRMSGMTPTFPADFFTVVVKTRHPLKRSAADTLPTPDSPGQVHGARAPSFSTILPASKRPRLAPAVSSEVLSTREIYHHPRVQIRRALGPTTTSGAESNSASSVDGDDAAHGPWSYGQLVRRLPRSSLSFSKDLSSRLPFSHCSSPRPTSPSTRAFAPPPLGPFRRSTSPSPSTSRRRPRRRTTTTATTSCRSQRRRTPGRPRRAASTRRAAAASPSPPSVPRTAASRARRRRSRSRHRPWAAGPCSASNAAAGMRRRRRRAARPTRGPSASTTSSTCLSVLGSSCLERLLLPRALVLLLSSFWVLSPPSPLLG